MNALVDEDGYDDGDEHDQSIQETRVEESVRGRGIPLVRPPEQPRQRQPHQNNRP